MGLEFHSSAKSGATLISNNRKYSTTVSILVVRQMQLVLIRWKVSLFRSIQQIVPFQNIRFHQMKELERE
jgi:hypothetical protein